MCGFAQRSFTLDLIFKDRLPCLDLIDGPNLRLHLNLNTQTVKFPIIFSALKKKKKKRFFFLYFVALGRFTIHAMNMLGIGRHINYSYFIKLKLQHKHFFTFSLSFIEAKKIRKCYNICPTFYN